jgi:hypothetical protein
VVRTGVYLPSVAVSGNVFRKQSNAGEQLVSQATHSSNLKATVLFMDVFVFFEAKRKSRMKTFRTVAGRLFKK